MPDERIKSQRAREMFRRGCEAYLRLFCQKHGYDYHDAVQNWVTGDVVDVVEVGDMFLDMDDIRTDIDMDAPQGEIVRWWDYCYRCATIDPGMPTPNYENWLRGCPRKSEEEIQKLELLRRKVEMAKAELENAIENDKGEF